MYLGEFKSKFTGKGRVVLPKEVRKLAGNRIVLKKGLDGCLEGYGLRDWQKQYQDKLDLSGDKASRFRSRYFFASSEVVELDNQGRFVIPLGLLEFGRISTEVAIIGAGDHFEIWDLGIWQQQVKGFEEVYE